MKFEIAKLFTIFLIFASFSGFCQEQEKIDSLLNLLPSQKDTALINTYEELFISYITKEPKKAKPYLDAALLEVGRLNNKKYTAKFNKYQGIYYNAISDYRKAIVFYKKAIESYEVLGDKEQLSIVYNNLGISQKYNGKLKEALESHMKSLALKEELGLSGSALAASYINIGVLHSDLGNIEVSNEYYKKGEAICIEQNLQWQLTMVRANLAINLRDSGQFEEALAYTFKIIPYLEENGYLQDLAKHYNTIGALYSDLDSLQKAEKYYNKALKLSEEKGELQMVGLITRNLGDIHFTNKNYRKALEKFKKSLDISRQSGTETRMLEDYLKIAKTQAAMGDYQKAYQLRKLHFDKYDTIFKKENVDKINELEIQYQTEKKEQQIALQEKEIDLLEEQAKVGNLQRILLVVALLLSLIGFYAVRQKMKRNKLEKEKVDAELEFKKKELTTHALNLARKNETLENLKLKAQRLKEKESSGTGYNQLIRSINFDLQDDNNWENFSRYFEEVHKDFNRNVKTRYPQVTSNELRLLALLKMNLSSKEIANILNISPYGIKKARYRLRKKLDLATEDSLQDLVLSL